MNILSNRLATAVEILIYVHSHPGAKAREIAKGKRLSIETTYGILRALEGMFVMSTRGRVGGYYLLDLKNESLNFLEFQKCLHKDKETIESLREVKSGVEEFLSKISVLEILENAQKSQQETEE